MKSVLQNKWMSLVLLAVVFLVIYNPLTRFPYTFCVIIIFILISTYLQNGDLKSLNFKNLKSGDIKNILVSYLILELTVDFIIQPLVNWLCNEPADYSAFKNIEGDASQYFKWLYRMWISAAIGEELLFRAFAFAQLRNVFGDKKVIVVVLSALLFCLPHMYQGIAGLIMTFAFGIAFALLYIKYQNIWINIIVHGLIDTVFLSLSYFGYIEFYEFIW
ncbi:CPBP family intramembrane glutamic endopeptidase [Chryseobacterium indoltheticum]|uniref:CPBP family intramembrane glutamic endopeptidase n=1 Tax=Chryseobacterium indoltheticum TaxID=254 RepID=UPI0019137CAF|nr:CPBP family intramembrane glutamic endopeptidase [Chryseobacterium indoltheticum]QQQ29170.1 CPBP family intramembrane metalloprotease [Chryseobacterium indoltheticum]